MPQLYVNGESIPVEGEVALLALLRLRGVDPEQSSGVAVALNERVVRRAAWGETMLLPGDRIEIVTARQGG